MIRLLRNLAVFLTTALAASAAYAADVPAIDVGGFAINGPAVVGLASCLLVRIYLWTVSTNKLLIYNVSLTLLAMLGAAVHVIDHKLGYSAAFMIGVGYGSGAVALIEFGRSQVMTNIKAALLNGVKTPPADPPAAA